MEEFRNVFDNYYISNKGNLKRTLKNGNEKVVNGSVRKCGYRYFQVKREGKCVNKAFHHLVAQAFMGERPTGLVIDHIDRDKLNNDVSNLRYVSYKENCGNRAVKGSISEKVYGKNKDNYFYNAYYCKAPRDRVVKCFRNRDDAENWLKQMRIDYPR